MSIRDFLTNAINKVLTAILGEKPLPPAVVPKIPAPYTSEYDACKGLMQKYAVEFNAVAEKHPGVVHGMGVGFDRLTGDPYAFIHILKGYKGDLSDVPEKFGNELPVKVEFRSIARG